MNSDQDTSESCLTDEENVHSFQAVLNFNLSHSLNNHNNGAQSVSPGTKPSYTVTSRMDGVQELLENAELDSSDVIPEWSLAKYRARFFALKDGTIDLKDQIGPRLRVSSKNAMNVYMKQMSKLRLGRVHHFATLGEYMHNLYKRQKLADVIVRINGQIFATHRHVLSCHSKFFADLFFNSNLPAYAMTEVVLTNISTENFALFMHFIYIGEIHLTQENVGSLLDLSNALQSYTLKSRIFGYLSQQSFFELHEAINALNDPDMHDFKHASISSIGQSFQELLESPLSLKTIDHDDFKEIISSEFLNINTELDVFWAVLFWIWCDANSRLKYIDEMMSLVRFSTMSTLELMDCARALETLRQSEKCRLLLIQANWLAYIRERGIKDPLKIPKQFPRFILHEKPHYETCVYEFDKRYLQFKELSFVWDTQSVTTNLQDSLGRRKSGTKVVKFAEDLNNVNNSFKWPVSLEPNELRSEDQAASASNNASTTSLDSNVKGIVDTNQRSEDEEEPPPFKNNKLPRDGKSTTEKKGLLQSIQSFIGSAFGKPNASDKTADTPSTNTHTPKGARKGEGSRRGPRSDKKERGNKRQAGKSNDEAVDNDMQEGGFAENEDFNASNFKFKSVPMLQGDVHANNNVKLEAFPNNDITTIYKRGNITITNSQGVNGKARTENITLVETVTNGLDLKEYNNINSVQLDSSGSLDRVVIDLPWHQQNRPCHFSDSLNLLDRPDAEMNLIPPPLLQPLMSPAYSTSVKKALS